MPARDLNCATRTNHQRLTEPDAYGGSDGDCGRMCHFHLSEGVALLSPPGVLIEPYAP